MKQRRESLEKHDEKFISSPLPVTVVIPSLDTIDAVAGHLSAIRDTLHRVAKIIVVDSSGQEVVDLYRRELSGLSAEIYELSPGLYQAWNFAVRKAETEYVYFSTIGDTLLSGGLDHLVDVAIHTGADVVISPPRMINAAGNVTESVRWPTHYVIEALDEEESPAKIFGPLAVMLFSSFLPATVLGSSASNIYRTQALEESPFPETFGAQGDVVWAYQNAPRLRFAFTRAVCANFQLIERHGELPAQEQASKRMFEGLNGVLDERFRSVPSSAEMSIARGWAKCMWQHHKWTHKYVQWHEELRVWSEKLEKWNAFLEGRDKSSAGRLEGIFSRALSMPFWKRKTSED